MPLKKIHYPQSSVFSRIAPVCFCGECISSVNTYRYNTHYMQQLLMKCTITSELTPSIKYTIHYPLRVCGEPLSFLVDSVMYCIGQQLKYTIHQEIPLSTILCVLMKYTYPTILKEEKTLSKQNIHYPKIHFPRSSVLLWIDPVCFWRWCIDRKIWGLP